MPKTLWRTLLLALLGLLMLAAMAAWVKLTQHRPAADDPLRVTVPQDIIFPWQQAELWVDYSGAEGEIRPTEPLPQTILFLIDTSGSMSDYLGDAIRAIFEMQRNIATGNNHPRIGVMEFATTARVVSPFTADMDQLAARLRSPFPGAGGGTNFPSGLSAALDMLAADGGTGAVIMLTDGEDGSGTDLARFYDERWRPSGNELYLVGVGSDASDPATFYDLTEDPSRYILSSADYGVLGTLFDEIAARIGNSSGRNGRLTLPLAEPLWSWGSVNAPDAPNAPRTLITTATSDPEQFPLGWLFARPYEWHVPLDPKMGGILTTLHAPAELDYLSQGKTLAVTPHDGTAPKVLVITWWLLFMLMLPALANLLAGLLAWLLRPAPEPTELAPVQWRKEHRPPPNLPMHLAPDAQRIHWAPSLLIGLGRSGRAVLTHVRQNLADSFDQPATRPVLLALDVARDELNEDGHGEPVPGCLEPLGTDQVFVLPPQSCALYDAVHQQQERARRSPDDPAAALDLTPYEGMGADALRLTKGTQGESPLARLALLNDLADGESSALLRRLRQALDEWRQIAPEERARQIVLVANVGGGVGAGWLSDLVILLRRLVNADETDGKAVEINLLLLGDEDPRRGDLIPLTSPVLFSELERLATAGSRPFRHRLATLEDTDPAHTAGHDAALSEVLDGWVRKRPQDAIFVLPRSDRSTRDSYPAAADVLTLLIDQRRRIELTHHLQSIQGAETWQRASEGIELYTQLAINDAAFPRSFFRELLLVRLTNLIGNRQVLFPELQTSDGRPALTKLPVDTQTLCGLDPAGDPLGLVAALSEAGLGHCAALQSLPLDPDSLSEAVNAMRLALISNSNTALRNREIGLLGLAEMSTNMAKGLTDCAGKLGNSQMLLDFAEGFAAVARQALTWIELFFGSRLIVELGFEAVIGGRIGLLPARSTDFERVVADLVAWDRGSSRTLVAPITASDLTRPEDLQLKLDDLMLTFIRSWLATDTGLVESLAERCYWELTAPGVDGQPIGINLVLRGSRPRRYAPSESELLRFEADLREETGPVIDQSNDFHILSLLHAETDEGDDRAALAAFVERLKGQLRGERSGLIATVPDLRGVGDPGLHAFRVKLVRTLTELTVNAAERVDVTDVSDRNRISVLHTLPLLRSDHTGDRTGADVIRALHRPERLLVRESRKVADALGRQSMELPAVIGLALEDRERLHRFAQLYMNGQVLRHEMDGLWYARGGGRLVRLTPMPAQPLADAAASYVTRGLDIAVEPALCGEPQMDDSGGDLIDYLAWLAAE